MIRNHLPLSNERKEKEACLSSSGSKGSGFFEKVSQLFTPSFQRVDLEYTGATKQKDQGNRLKRAY